VTMPFPHSFPTRRSSDLIRRFHLQAIRAIPRGGRLHRLRASLATLGAEEAFALHGGFRACLLTAPENVPRHRNLLSHFIGMRVRSEEHTSELQSPDHLVC